MLICVVFFALAAALIAGKEQNLERLGLPARRRPGRGSAAVVRKTSRPVPSSFPLWRRGMVPGDAGIPVPRPGDGESAVADGTRVGALEKLEESQARGGRSGHPSGAGRHRGVPQPLRCHPGRGSVWCSPRFRQRPRAPRVRPGESALSSALPAVLGEPAVSCELRFPS